MSFSSNGKLKTDVSMDTRIQQIQQCPSNRPSLSNTVQFYDSAVVLPSSQ